MHIMPTWGKTTHIISLNTKFEESQDQPTRFITFGRTFQPTMPRYNLRTSLIYNTQIQD